VGIARLLPITLVALAPFVNAYQVPAPAEHESVSASTPATTFDVVSIRPSDSKNPGMQIRPGKDSFTITGGSLKFIIQNAYDLQDFQIEGAPAWIDSARFDIIAKTDAPSPPTSTPAEKDAEQKLTEIRLQSLLADRFQMRVHTGTKEMPAYALVVAKGGQKLRPSTKNTGYTSRQGQLVCSGMSMDSLASVLSGMESRIVVDQTKLPGDYAFTLKWAPDDTTNANADLPGLFTAIQEQLGLKLIPAKAPVRILIIDHIEKPSEN
jgi:bla regulator protein blaR1